MTGFGLFLAAAVVVAIGFFVFRLPDPVVMIGAGVVLFVVDLAMRLARRPNKEGLFDRTSGGHLFFAPAWVFGAVVIAINVVSFAATKLGR